MKLIQNADRNGPFWIWLEDNEQVSPIFYSDVGAKEWKNNLFKLALTDEFNYGHSITRLEVIDGKGRSYVNTKIEDIEFSVQDEGRTLKIFTKDEQNDNL